MKVKYVGDNPVRHGARLVQKGDELDLPDGTAKSLAGTPDWEQCEEEPKKVAKKVAKKVSKKANEADKEQQNESES